MVIMSESQIHERSKQLTWLQLLKGWAVLCVVINHALILPVGGFDHNALDEWTFAASYRMLEVGTYFRMPLFIMVSGFLLYLTRIRKGWKFDALMRDKFIRLGIPFLFFTTLAILLKSILPQLVSRNFNLSLTDILLSYLSPYNGAMREMWFVMVILTYFAFYKLYIKIFRKLWSVALCLAIAAVMYLLPWGNEYTPLSLNRSIHFFIFFFSGLCIHHYELSNLFKKPLIFGLGFAAFIIIKWCLATMLNFENMQILGEVAHLMGSLGACVGFWGLSIWLDSNVSRKIFSSFRDYSYQIFLMGIFFQTIVKNLYQHFPIPGSAIFWFALNIFAGVYLPVLVTKLLKRLNYKPLLICIGAAA